MFTADPGPGTKSLNPKIHLHLVPGHEEGSTESEDGESSDLDSEPWLVLDGCG
jgi:hypothetical protein